MKPIKGYENYLISEEGEVFSTSGHKKALIAKEGSVRLYSLDKYYTVSLKKLIDSNLKGLPIKYFIPKKKINELTKIKEKINDLQLKFDSSNVLDRIKLLPRLNALKHKLNAMKQLKKGRKKFWNHFQYRLNVQQK